MSGEEIPLTLEEPGKGGGTRRSWLVVAFVIGAVIGVAIGYYVNVATLNYAFNMLQAAQTPPPDYALIFFSPKQMFVATALGTPVRGSEIFLPGGGYDVFLVLDSACEADGITHVYAVDRVRNAIVAMDTALKIYSVVFPRGEVVGAVALDAHTIAVATRNPNKVIIYAFNSETKELVETMSADLDGEPAAIAYIDEPYPEIMVALKGGTVMFLDPVTLSVTRSISVQGEPTAAFLGVKYFFIGTADGKVMAFNRDDASQISMVAVGAPVKQLLACRGILFALHENGVHMLRIPTLDIVKTLETKALKMRAAPLCTAVYLLHDSSVTYIAVPSLRTVEKTLPGPVDDVVYVMGGTVVVAETRKVTLACGG